MVGPAPYRGSAPQQRLGVHPEKGFMKYSGLAPPSKIETGAYEVCSPVTTGLSHPQSSQCGIQVLSHTPRSSQRGRKILSTQAVVHHGGCLHIVASTSSVFDGSAFRGRPVRSMAINGMNGSATNTDDMPKKGGADVLDSILGTIEEKMAAGLKQHAKSMEQHLLDSTLRKFGKSPLVKTQARSRTKAQPQWASAVVSQPSVAELKPAGSVTVGGTGKLRSKKVVKFDSIIGNVYWPASATNNGWETTPLRFCPVAAYPHLYEEGKEYRTYRIRKLRIELIPNDVGIKDGIFNGTWSIVPSYTSTPLAVNSIREVECSGGVHGSTNRRLVFDFDAGRISRELVIPKQGYTPDYENTACSFTVCVQRASGANITDYALFGEWKVVGVLEYMDPMCTTERFGTLDAYATGVVQASPLGTTLSGFQTAGYLWGSSVDVTNKKITLMGLQIGDNIELALAYVGTSAAFSYTFTDITVAGLSTAQDLEPSTGTAFGYCFNPPAATASKFMVRYRFLATATYATLTWGTASTFPAATCQVAITVRLNGNNRNVTQMKSSVLQSQGSGHINDPQCPIAQARRSSGQLSIDINPPPPQPEPLPPNPDQCSLVERPDEDFICPTMDDEDLTVAPSSTIEPITKEEWELIRAQRCSKASSK